MFNKEPEHLKKMEDNLLIEKCRDWIKSLCETGAKSWTLTIPPNFDKDPDLLFCELIERFEKYKNQ